MTGIASGAIGEGRAVTLESSDLTFSQVNSLSDVVHGFAKDGDATDGSDFEIYREGGDAIGLAGGAISRGDRLIVDASGRLVVDGRAIGGAIGYALEDAASGELFAFAYFPFPFDTRRFDLVIADGAIAANRCVNLKTNANTVEQVDNVDDRVHGISKSAATDGDSLEIWVEGEVAQVQISGAVTLDASLEITSDGRVSATSTAGDACVGYALEAGSNNEVIDMFFTRFTI